MEPTVALLAAVSISLGAGLKLKNRLHRARPGAGLPSTAAHDPRSMAAIQQHAQEAATRTVAGAADVTNPYRPGTRNHKLWESAYCSRVHVLMDRRKRLGRATSATGLGSSISHVRAVGRAHTPR